jgi:PBP4 family serine-type D-alanyl-D-alanine carboxypeptidase
MKPSFRPVLAAVVSCSSCCALVRAAPSPAEGIARVLARPELKTSTVGVFAARVKNGEMLYELNADKLFPPASNTKLVSCAGALVALGKDFRFTTRVVAKGAVKDGVLHGDLVFVASGDPNLSQRITADGRLLFEDKDHSYAGFYDATLVPGDPLIVVKDLARQVKAAGIHEVHGDVIVDDGLFAETDDEFVGTFSAACVNDGLIDVTVTPGEKPGDPARFEYQPKGSLVEVVSTAKTVEASEETAVWVESRDGQASFDLSGKIPVGAPPVLRTASYRKPAIAVAGFLSDALREQGVAVRGREKQRRLGPSAYAEDRTLATHTSPPLSEALKVTLKVSQNLHATMLPVIVGALRGERGDRASGYGVIRGLLERQGLDVDAVVLQSGSGGGRGDHLSPRWTVSLLRSMASREDFSLFVDMLPLGGVDGTLATAFRDPAFGRRVHAKTGTLVYRGELNEKWI